MFRAHISSEREIPWWAVIGAPLIGVPAVVAVLALVGPSERVVEELDEFDVAVEQVELEPVSTVPAHDRMVLADLTFLI